MAVIKNLNIFFILSTFFTLLSVSPCYPEQEAVPIENWELEKIGVYQVSSDSSHFGGISSIIVEQSGQIFTALSDKARYFTGTILRASNGSIRSVTTSRAHQLLSSKGEPLENRNLDSEAFVQSDDGNFFISFESNDRVMRHSKLDSPGEFLPVHEDFDEFHYSKGIEALAISKEGILYAIPESPTSGDQQITAYKYDGGKWEESFVIGSLDDFDITDAIFGPDNTLIILERNYSWFGFTSRIRRFQIVEDKAVLIQTLLKSRFREFDNLEGISMWLDKNGEYWLTLVSDDNFNIFQITQLVEFKVKFN